MKEVEKIKIMVEKGSKHNPITGEVFSHTGKKRISTNSDGYIQMSIKYEGKILTVKAHRYIYYLEKGEIKGEIDHINGIRNDNRLINLRDVTKLQNQQNRTTAKGVYWHKVSKKFFTKIVKNGITKWGGCFDTPEETRLVYLELKKNKN